MRAGTIGLLKPSAIYRTLAPPRQTSSRLQRFRSHPTSRPLSSTLPRQQTSPADTSKPHVTVESEDGRLLRQNVKHTPKAKLDRLIPALNELLHATQRKRWKLSSEGDGVELEEHSYASEEDARRVVIMIQEVADEMNHHPEIEILNDNGAHKNVGGSANAPPSPWLLKIRCTTHQPAGLSMRDVRLAQKINEILDHHRPIDQ